MSVRLRNISLQRQTVTVVRPNITYERTVFSLEYLNLTDEEFVSISPPLVEGVWEIDNTPDDDIGPPPPPAANTIKVLDGANRGDGTGQVFKVKDNSTLEFRTLKAGANTIITTVDDTIVISSTGGGGGGTVTNADNAAGTGTGLVFKEIAIDTLIFKRILAGNLVTVTNLTNDIKIGVTLPLASATPAAVGTAAVGVSTYVARADHAHEGIHSVKKTGSPQLFGDVTFTEGSNVSIAQVGNDLTISASGGNPSITAGSDINASGSVGVSALYARADHTHKGVLSVAKFGDSAINGSVTLSEGTNISLTQTGSNIQVAVVGVLNSLEATTTVSSAEILNLHTTAITLVPAPGAGKFIDVDAVECFLSFNSIPYIAGSDLLIDFETSQNQNLSVDAGVVKALANSRRFEKPSNPVPDTVELGINEAIKLISANAFTSGDSTLKIKVHYRIYDALT